MEVKERTQAQAQLEDNRKHREKEGRMKKRHIVLLAILVYFVYSMISSGPFSRTGSAGSRAYHTDHYTLTLPGEWTCDQYEENNFTFSYSDPDSAVKDIITFSEFDYSDPVGIDTVRDVLNPLLFRDVDGFTLLETRTITIHQDEAYFTTGNKTIDGSPQRMCFVLYPFDDHVAFFGYTSRGRSDEDIERKAESYAKRISTCLYDIAADEFDDDLESISKVDSSGYIFVKAQMHGSDASSAISSFEYDAADFLKSLRSLVESGDVDFTEVSFEGYTDLVDKYGNVKNESVLQFWITRETLDKINFENFNPKNFEFISTNWYLHPAMKK